MSDDLEMELVRDVAALQVRLDAMEVQQKAILEELKTLVSLNDKRKGAFWAFGVLGSTLALLGFSAFTKIVEFLKGLLQ